MTRILTHLDLVMGVDLHPEMVPTPGGPVPVPMPNPFIGMVYDPRGIAAGIVVNNMIAAYDGEDPTLGIVLANRAPVAVVGDDAIAVVKHILLPPGTSWAPIPGAPPPPLVPGAPPRAPTVGSPANNAMIIQGSIPNLAMGSSIAVDGSLLMSCAEPVRLPTSMAQAIPKGAPVDVGGPLAVNFLAAAIGALRTRWVGALARAFARQVSRLSFARLSCMLARRFCRTVGHPVDVASGRLLTDHVDFELPGPLPLTFERAYSSRFANRTGPLGYGWSHSLDQAVWREDRYLAVVYRDHEGREIEFHTDGLPAHTMVRGDSLYDPINRLTLTDDGGGRFRVVDAEGVTREFAPIVSEREQAAALERAGGTPLADGPTERRLESRLTKIRSRDGHEIRLYYDQHGLLHRVLDSANREIFFEHEGDRLVEVRLPSPDGRGHERAWKYEYDEKGDLRRAFNALNDRFTYDYDHHLMVRECDPSMLSFYFEYDGLEADAYCTRTWGHGGIHDTLLDYDKKGRKTLVTATYEGEKTLYAMNPALLVTEVEQAGFRKETFEYDEHAHLARHVDRRGGEWRLERDERGNVTRVTRPDQSSEAYEYGAFDDRPVRVLDTNGNEWRFRYDEHGREVEAIDPEGGTTRTFYKNGLATRVEHRGGLVSKLEYDHHKNLVTLRTGHHDRQRIRRLEYDARGQVTRMVGPRGDVTTRTLDAVGRVIAKKTPDGDEWEYAYDRANNLVLRVNNNSRTEYEYDGYHHLASVFWTVGDNEVGRVRIERDLEGRLASVTNENGERFEYRRDAFGRVVEEVGFDGMRRRFFHDPAGEVVEVRRQRSRDDARTVLHSRIERDLLGRVTSVTYGDGGFERFAYRADGALMRAENQDVTVTFERDALGRVIRETSHGAELEGGTVESGYRHDDERVRIRTSLGHHVQIRRNEHGEPIELEAGSGHRPWIVGFERDEAGAEALRRLPGGLTQAWAYEPDGLPLKRTIADTSARTVHETEYGWDYDAQLRYLRFSDGEGPTGELLYKHDVRGRLEVMKGFDGRPHWRSMDPAGNIHGNARADDHTYGPGGQLLDDGRGTTYRYDPQGNRVEKRMVNPDGDEPLVDRYRWSDAGTLTEVDRADGTRVSFLYDALRRRVKKTVARDGPDGLVEESTEFLWDGDVPVHERREGAEAVTWVFDPDTFAPLGRFEGTERQAILTDHLGTPTEGVTELGEIAWRMQLDLFGVERAVGDVSSCPWRFPGQYLDEETGLYYNRARYYDPSAAAYLSRDPLGLNAGINLYAYVEDPTRLTDPLGLDPLSQGDLDRYGNFNTTDRVGDGLAGHEVLQNAWLQAHGHNPAGHGVGSASRGNPSIALDGPTHGAVGRAQRRAGLFRRANLLAMRASENIAKNARILLDAGFPEYQVRALVQLARNHAANVIRQSRRRPCG